MLNYRPVPERAWEHGKIRELNFWRHWLSERADEFTVDVPLRPYLSNLIEKVPAPVIADIGSGAACIIGNVYKDGLRVVPSDRLADEYAEMWRELGKQPKVPVEKQDMLALTYPDNTFDVVYCANALDHSTDPWRAIKEMARVCKPKGMIYLRHMTRVGRAAHYRGLHMWNIERMPDHDVRVWRDGNEFLMSECLPNMVSRLRADWRDRGEGAKVIVRWRKP